MRELDCYLSKEVSLKRRPLERYWQGKGRVHSESGHAVYLHCAPCALLYTSRRLGQVPASFECNSDEIHIGDIRTRKWRIVLWKQTSTLKSVMGTLVVLRILIDGRAVGLTRMQHQLGTAEGPDGVRFKVAGTMQPKWKRAYLGCVIFTKL